MEAAARAGVPTGAFCDQISQKFEDVFKQSNIAYDDYLRTTQPRHTVTVRFFDLSPHSPHHNEPPSQVQEMWHTLRDKGYIYKGKHEGWYCKVDECFIPETQLVRRPKVLSAEENAAKVAAQGEVVRALKARVKAEGATADEEQRQAHAAQVKAAVDKLKRLKTGAALENGEEAEEEMEWRTETGSSVEWVSEENYKFKLSAFEQPLLEWLKNDPDVVYPPARYTHSHALTLTCTQLTYTHMHSRPYTHHPSS
jgi:methionyl-tRNA synthetase